MKPVLEILRLEEDFRWGTFGMIKINKEVFCCTLEPADQGNIPHLSSIPAQQYTCKKYSSMRYPSTYQIMNVPGREKVLFHAGNVVRHTNGCVILAQYWGKLKNERAILNSGQTFKEFMEILKGHEELHLTIKEQY